MAIHKHDNQAYLDAADQSLSISAIKTGVNAASSVYARGVNFPATANETFFGWSSEGGLGWPEHLKFYLPITVLNFTLGIDEEGMARWASNQAVTCTLRLRKDTAGGVFSTESYSKVINYSDMIAAESGVADAYFSFGPVDLAVTSNEYLKFSLQWSNGVVPGGVMEFNCIFIINIQTS